MKNDNFDEILTETLKEYVKDKERKTEDVPKVEFSKRHEENMKKLFKSVADGTFDDIEETRIELKNKKNIYIKHVRVAAFILLGLIVSLAIAPTMSAWRKEELGLYGDDMDEYAWGLRNDTTEILEAPRNNVDEYKDLFGYMPEGFEMVKAIKTHFFLYIEFENKNSEKIKFKCTFELNNAIDMTEIYYDRQKFDGFDVKYVEKIDENIAIWFNDGCEYRLYGNFGWDEIEKIISNIKYEEFEKNF